MERLPAFGTAISEVVMPTFKAYVPLLMANASAIKSTKRETFTYGPNPRQALDVYTPSASTDTTPIFVFIYGGGLVRGDKILPVIPNELVHANVGHFLAEKLGCVAVIPDYRLISHGAKFPSGGEDIGLVVSWIKEKFEGKRELFMMGNSAGGIHMSTWLYFPLFAKSVASVISEDASLKLRGVVQLSVPFHFRSAAADRSDVLKAYYGDEIESHCPLGLLEAIEKDSPALGIPTLVLNGTLDPEDEILEPKADFVRTYKKTLPSDQASLLTVEMMEGQNHISPPLSLGTNKPDEEAWGYQLQAWMKSIAS
jgi:acetyl esterase/lipase